MQLIQHSSLFTARLAGYWRTVFITKMRGRNTNLMRGRTTCFHYANFIIPLYVLLVFIRFFSASNLFLTPYLGLHKHYKLYNFHNLHSAYKLSRSLRVMKLKKYLVQIKKKYYYYLHIRNEQASRFLSFTIKFIIKNVLHNNRLNWMKIARHFT